MEIRNFGANVTFQPESFFVPKSEEEVLAILGSTAAGEFAWWGGCIPGAKRRVAMM